MLDGLGFLLGKGDFPREVDDVTLVCESVRSGTAALERRFGFLWVISDLSTFRSVDVTEDPWFSCSNTADMSLPPLATGLAAVRAPGGGGGGGGGPPPRSKVGRGGGGGGADTPLTAAPGPDRICLSALIASMPSLFQVKPNG